MREEVRRYHLVVLSTHQAIMFETLIHKHNITTDSVKAYTLEDENGMETEPMRGFIALKDTDGKGMKYMIEDGVYDFLPIRVHDSDEFYLKDSATKKSVILRPVNPTPFKITPEQAYKTQKQFIDDFAPFEHTHPDMWTVMKMVAIMGYVGKSFVGVCSPAETGKSSIYEILHSITKKSPVFQPRSVPGILTQVNCDGNMVFDEVHKSNSETRNCMENFTLQVAGNKPIYINGAMKTHHTKSKYDITNQSITFLYNVYSYYNDPEKEFFDNFFSNNGAIDSRILKLKFDGKLLEDFTKDFDIIKTAEQNKMYYIKLAKHLLWLKQLKMSNKHQRKYDYVSVIKLDGRKRLIYDEITWMIDLYSEDLDEYKKWIQVLDTAINDYKKMMGVSILKSDTDDEQKMVEEEI